MSPLISEKREGFPILIVDRIGDVGKTLADKLSKESTVVLVTENDPSSENILYIPFESKIPKIPDNVYSHIFIVDDGEDITIEFLSSFLNKAKQDKAVLCFCTNIENQEKIPQDLLEYKKTKVIFLGDVFPGKGLFSKSYVNKFINSSKNRGKINIPQDGMSISYPVFWEDAILSILEASFGTSFEKIYYAFSKHGVTLLSLAHMMQRIDPEIKIDFSQEQAISNTPMYDEGKYLLPEKYPLEEKLKKLKITAGKYEKKTQSEIRTTQKDRSLPDFPFVNIRIAIFAIIFFLFLPLITTLFFTFMAFLSLDLVKTSPNDAKYFLGFSKNSFDLANAFSKTLSYEAGFFQLEPLNGLATSIEKGRKDAGAFIDYYTSIDFFAQGKTGGGISSLKNFIIYSQSKSSPILGSSLQSFISETIDVWPQILALDSKKTYLILFQNNSTVRPTGGIIQDFAFLTFKNGKFSDFKVYNTADSDKNLKGHIEPPFGLRRYLPSTNLFMKDSNFNPDFLDTSASASFFANLEEGQKVDGVIAVDLNFIKELEKKLGSNIGAQDQVLSENRLYNLFNKLKKENSFKIFLAKEFTDLIENKNIIFGFNDPSIENIFSSNNFSSTLSDIRENSPKKINDYSSIIESDLGEPVSNIEREIKMKTTLSPNGDVLSDLLLEYKNDGNNDYKNYLRFIVPGNASIEKIIINGTDTDFINAITDPTVYEAKDFTPPQKLEVESYSERGKNFFGFLTQIPKGRRSSIEFIYKFSTVALSDTSNFSYNLKFFKQPGISSYPFNFSISYPDSFKIFPSSSISKTVDKDFDLNFNFSQK